MIRYVGENVVETVCKFAVMNTLYPVMTVYRTYVKTKHYVQPAKEKVAIKTIILWSESWNRPHKT